MKEAQEGRLKKLLSELGDAIGGSVSGSDEVNEWIRRIREQGYHIYVVLDAKIGVDRDRKKAYNAARRGRRAIETQKERPDARTRHVLYGPHDQADFLMNRGDVLFLQSLGIDGTRRIRAIRRNLPDLLAD